MNAGIVISYIISGILIIGIITLNLNVTQTSIDTTMLRMSETYVTTISEMVEYDIPKIGYDLTEMTDTLIMVAEKNRIKFKGNIDGVGSSETVEWIFDPDDSGTELTHTENPNDYSLKRIVDGDVNTLNFGVTKFEIAYYMNGVQTPMSTPVTGSDLKLIRKIEIKLICETSFQNNYENTGRFVSSVWEKTFAPMNLSLN